jgi:hypothetical protein
MFNIICVKFNGSQLFLLIIFTILITILVQTSNQQQCTAGGLKKMDATIAKLITIGNSGRKFPENKGNELKVYCE